MRKIYPILFSLRAATELLIMFKMRMYVLNQVSSVGIATAITVTRL